MANEDLTTEVRARDVRTNDGGGRDREFRERFRLAFASIANEGFAIAIETRDRDRSDWIGLDWIRSSMECPSEGETSIASSRATMSRGN